MIIIDGVYKGTNNDPYDFPDEKGRQIKGVSNNAFVEVDDLRIKPNFRVKLVKLPKDYSVKAKVGDRVVFEVDLKGDKLIMLCEAKK